ncbi:hypothetical protein GCM10011354_11450 [Egicoccus halophilus]|uniref:DUF4350 domain-containing protein n=1 Tax=Egicoccus halophilus TaxID=1670830 RepID=A0A8J3A8U3_9ACTN|nr:hypothetical protein GCM10011354_11450 [Egicoccus halophilus]
MVSLVAAGLLAGPTTEEAPLDPSSSAPDGLLGLVEVLRASDVPVEVGLELPEDPTTRLFVPLDRLNRTRQAEVRDWVAAGGHLVVADPTSPLHELTPVGGGLVDSIGPTGRAPGCDALPAVSTVTHASWTALEVPAEADAVCFVLGEELAWLVATGHGQGTIVALGSPDPFTNRLLDVDDHAVLAASLLAPTPGAPLQIVPLPPVGEGETAIADLVPDRVWQGLAVLLVAAVVAAVARGRRLGLPVEERLPPVLPASELVGSLAGLLQRSGRRGSAADLLRQDARTAVAAATGLSADGDPQQLASLAVDRLGVDVRTADRALLDAPVDDDETLRALQTAVSSVRRRARGGPVSSGSSRSTDPVEPSSPAHGSSVSSQARTSGSPPP